eukprot:363416-Rhodomonas_salina.2
MAECAIEADAHRFDFLPRCTVFAVVLAAETARYVWWLVMCNLESCVPALTTIQLRLHAVQPNAARVTRPMAMQAPSSAMSAAMRCQTGSLAP